MKDTKRALLLEDNEMDAAITCRLLEHGEVGGFDVVRCTTLADAVVQLTRHNFEIALIDLNVTDSEGLDTVREALKAGPHTAIIVLTGASETQLAIEALDMGAQDFLPKSAISEHVLQRVIQYSMRRKNKENAIAAKAYVDNLTELSNRGFLMEQWDQIVARSGRAMRKIGLLLIDVNKFKQVNDVYGHQAGDLLLRDLATRLKTFVRKNDIVIRLGGDEFVVVLESVRTKDEVERLRDLLMTGFGGQIKVGERKIPYSLSVGSALTAPADQEDLSDALHRADLEMYEFKGGDSKPQRAPTKQAS